MFETDYPKNIDIQGNGAYFFPILISFPGTQVLAMYNLS
jgi:hypothetical protein